MKEKLRKTADFVLKIENFVVIVCCIAMITLVFSTVFIRYIFRTGYQGMEELVMLFAFGIYFIGAALGTHHETQITADMMSLFVKKPRKKLMLRAFQSLVDGVLIGICAIYSTQQMLFMYGIGGRTTGLKMPIWINYSIILVGLFLMSIYAISHFVKYLSRYIHYNDTENAVESGDKEI